MKLRQSHEMALQLLLFVLSQRRVAAFSIDSRSRVTRSPYECLCHRLAGIGHRCTQRCLAPAAAACTAKPVHGRNRSIPLRLGMVLLPPVEVQGILLVLLVALDRWRRWGDFCSSFRLRLTFAVVRWGGRPPRGTFGRSV
jgi:hypothetical protein